MEKSPGERVVERFVRELLRTGSMLNGLVADLVDTLPVDAYPEEEPAAVVVEMMCGTVATALRSTDPRDVRRATELMELAGARVIEHLRLACALSPHIHGDKAGMGGSDG